ncbi:MAG TPA: CHASE2 domain-containing protein [Candidatus Angelobacter sp.]|nr:CHASE2 domain-containing protein [Candidatus Angelobacter sp.]
MTDRPDSESSTATYAETVATGFRDVRSRRVTMVTLGEKTPARILNNVCEQRWYLARLIQRLAEHGAAVIVLDKYFGADSCGRDDQGTSDLIRVIQESQVPVVVGRATHPPASDPNNACLIVSGSLDFGNKRDSQGNPTSKPAVVYGLTRMNSDLRRIPLNWFTYRSDEDFSTHKESTDAEIETISYVAASLVDKRLKDDYRLQSLRESGEHPFTSFINPDSLSQIDASTVVCSGPDRQKMESRYSMNCTNDSNDDIDIRGHVLIVGQESTDRDWHQLLGRGVSGLYLQANYIESLLDERYLRPLGTKWNFFVFAGWLIALYLLFWIQPEIALVICCVVWWVMRYAVTQLALSKGLYLDLWVAELGLAAILLKYIDSRGHRVAEWVQERLARRHAGSTGQHRSHA